MNSNHAQRVAAAAVAFEAATDAFVSFFDRLSDSVSHARLPGGWTPAGHAAHLALTNDVFCGVLKGSAPIVPFPGTSDYSDDTWTMDAPPAATAPPILIPPANIRGADAVAHLRASSVALRAAIDQLDADLARQCVRLPWAAVSVYQMCEWASGHTVRHIVQVNRELQIGVIRGQTQVIAEK
jgi:hypothetical protein